VPLPDALPAGLLERCTFPSPGTPVVCAVSGGPDSLALLVLAVAAGCTVTAVHVDHQLREGSAAEADVVADAAARFGADFRAETVRVEPGPNLEARARSARRTVLPADAATGHTADDQAETVLLNLLRGAGLPGLAGMRPGPTHPILGVRRIETEDLCAALGLEPVRDPSNDDRSLRRNAIRHDALPFLDGIAGRDVVPLLVRTADQARRTLEHLEAEADRAVPDPTDASALHRAPEAVASVAAHRWLRSLSPEAHPVDAAAVARVLEVAAGRRRATEVPGGWRVVRSKGRLRIEPADAQPVDARPSDARPSDARPVEGPGAEGPQSAVGSR
jgi:tRNA(Ile)-lysidine synthase